jgi:(2Fe-2S) ferredoxin
MTLAPGNWYWSIKTTDAQNIVKTRIFGSLEILDAATQ